MFGNCRANPIGKVTRMNRSLTMRIVSIVGLVVVLMAMLMTSIASAVTEPPSMLASASYGEEEDLGCVGGYDEIAAWDLKAPNGTKRSDIGGIVLSEEEVPGHNKFCATTQSGSRTQGHKKFMSIMLGWYDPDTGTHYWPMVEGDMYDAGWYRDYAGGVGAKVPFGAFRRTIDVGSICYD